MNDFQKEVIIAAMKKMFQGTHFSICDLDKCLKITGAIPDCEDYDALSALHCVNWSNMSPELRQAVYKKTISMLSEEGFDLSVINLMFNKEKNIFELPKKKKFKLLK